MRLSSKKTKVKSAYIRGCEFWRRAICALLCVVMLCSNAAGALATETTAPETETTQSEEATTEATEETAEATEATTEATEATTEATEATTEATEETAEATGATTEATEATTEATEETTEATEETTEATEEATEPTEETGLCPHGGEDGADCPICLVQAQINDFLLQCELAMEQVEELDEEAMMALTQRLYEQGVAAVRAYNSLEREQRLEIENFDMLAQILETFAIQTLDLDTATMDIETAEIWAEGTANQTLADGNFSVDFSKQFTLHIVVKSTLNLPNKKVEITVPDGLTVVEYPIPERGGMAESVMPEKIEDLNSANNYGGYCPQNGTITYSLKNTAEENSFNIILAPDTTLWNRSTEQKLDELLTIRTYTGDIGDKSNQISYETISATPKITGKYNDTPGDNRAIQTGPRLSRVGVKTGVPTAADTSFALRQIWINPDKDYIDMPQFFQKLEVTIALPYYAGGDGNVYAELDHITWDPAGQSTRPNMLDPEKHKGDDGNYKNGFNFTVKKDGDKHTVTLTWENLYLEYGQEYFTPYFKWTPDCDVTTTDAVKWGSNLILNTGKSSPGCYEGETPTAGAASAVGGTITWQNGSTWYLYNGDCTTFSFTAQAGESMSVSGKANNKPIYNNHAGDSDIIYYLGQFHVVNQGGAASAEKVVEFTYAYNDKIGVTAQKIPATTGNEVSVWYTTTQSESSPIPYENLLTSEGGFVTFTAEMAGLKEDEYFTRIIASVGSYEKDYVGYVSSRDQDPTSGYATTFGKLLTQEAVTYTNFATMKMYDDVPDKTKQITTSYNVTVTGTAGEIPPGMEQAYKENSLERVPILSDPETGESKTKATAGDTITFNGLLSSSAYPYSSNNIMTDPVIYIRLPEKITVNNLKLYQEVGRMADKVFLSDAVTETETSPKRTPISGTLDKISAPAVTADDATKTVYNLYKIDLRGNKVGWFTDTLGQYQIGISFDMEIAKDAEAMTLDMRDCVRFKSASLVSTSNNGTLSQYQVFDTYDMDGNGKTDERFSTFNVNAAGTKLSVVAARLGLTFTFGARVVDLTNQEPDYKPDDYSNYEVDKKKVFLKDNTHAVDMLFTLKNNTGRSFSEEEAKAFYYFIPIPKKGDFWDSHMQDEAFDFNMKLNDEPEVNGISKDNVLVKYSTTVDSTAKSGEQPHYSNPDNYVEASEIQDWSRVKMIRIAVKDTATGIRQNAEMEVYMHLVPEFLSNAELVGSVINFGPCGVSPYSVGNTTNQGHNPLPRIQVEFQTGVIEGKIFIDKDFNGTYTEGTDELYTEPVKVEAQHQNGHGTDDTEEHVQTTQNGTFQFTGRRADTYHVTVTNPGGTDANGTNPLKFSLPESGGKFQPDEGKDTVTATVVLDMNQANNDITAAQNLMIGLQQPHTVTFSVPNGQGGTTTKVWHGDKLGDVVPTVTADKGYRFTGNWTVGANTYTADQLKEVAISSDVIFTAEVKQLYSLTYHLNGGSGADAPATTWHIEGEKVRPDYTGTEKLSKGVKTIFVGWSEDTPIKDVLKADAGQDEINKIISTDEHTMPAKNVTLYAVYAVDANGNGKPDYNDDSVHVRYHGNDDVHSDVICPHHHVAGETVQLSTNGQVSGKILDHDADESTATEEVTSHSFTKGTNIFIGWSTSPMPDVIKTNADFTPLAGSIKNTVTMEMPEAEGGNADDDGNTNVYAVWAADRNNNKTADYLEEYTLTYDDNAQQGGTVSGLPRDPGVYIPGDKATLSTGNPAHSDVDGKKVVFIGWTEEQTNSIFSRADTAPATVTEITFGSANKTVYAAWGFDEDGDGTADVLETYSLTYDLNGGNGNAPAVQSNIPKGAHITLTTEKGFTRNDKEVFVGWSRTQNSAAYTADQKEAVNKVLITGTEIIMGTEDITLYAVWATDSNGNGYADYSESNRLYYDGNARENGSVLGLPRDSQYHIPGEKVTLTGAPTHTNVNEKKVLFLGWTEAQTGLIFSRADDAPKTITEVTFENSNITVYAAWGYDEDDDNTADVLETYSLSYDLNGGTGTIPTGAQGIQKNTEITLTTEKNFKRDANEVFIGWSRTKHEAAFKAGQEQEVKATMLADGKVTMGTEDIILYALWAEDSDGDGTPDYSTDCTVTYDLSGGTPAPGVSYGPEQVRMGTVITVKAAPTRKDYRFTGWTTDRVRTVYQPGDTLTVDGDLTLTAQWEQAPTEPSKPSEPTEPDDPDGQDKSPRTGDETRLGLWLTLAGIFGVGMIAIPVISKRRRKDKRWDR